MEIEKFEQEKWLSRLVWPKKDSHKGQNGRVLVIGGSSLFHVAPFWAANAASRIVDMVHFSSPYLLNNKLVEEKAKRGFWNGIVVPWEEVEKYIREDEVVLVGPGMMRSKASQYHVASSMYHGERGLVDFKVDDTRRIVGYLLQKYPEKKWVVDGGALQEVELKWLNENMIVTPNQKELAVLSGQLKMQNAKLKTTTQNLKLFKIRKLVEETGVTVVAKGEADFICSDGRLVMSDNNIEEAFLDIIKVEGGHPGMTKGGTGDVLAGIIAGLYAKNDALTATVVGSWLNKQIGEKLGREQVFFNASDMVGLVGVRF